MALDGRITPARAYLNRVAERLQARNLNVHTRVMVEDPPGRAIIEASHPAEIDLIALATHGRRGLSRLMLGSVADKVIRQLDRQGIAKEVAALRVGMDAKTARTYRRLGKLPSEVTRMDRNWRTLLRTSHMRTTVFSPG